MIFSCQVTLIFYNFHSLFFHRQNRLKILKNNTKILVRNVGLGLICYDMCHFVGNFKLCNSCFSRFPQKRVLLKILSKKLALKARQGGLEPRVKCHPAVLRSLESSSLQRFTPVAWSEIFSYLLHGLVITYYVGENKYSVVFVDAPVIVDLYARLCCISKSRLSF